MPLISIKNADGTFSERWEDGRGWKASGRPKRYVNPKFNWMHFHDWRKKRRYSYRKLAAELGVSRQTVSSWEWNRYTMPPDLIDRLKAVDLANGYSLDWWDCYLEVDPT